MLSLFTVAALLAVSPISHPSFVQDDPDGPDGYVPLASTPIITGQASGPITVTVKTQPTPESPQNHVDPDTFPFTITGKDLETWKRVSDNTTAQFADPLLICYKGTEQWPTMSGPSFRGTSTDNVGTWDLVAVGIVHTDQTIKGGPYYHPAQTYINNYTLANSASNRDANLNDDPITVQQTIIRPAYTQ